jgi:Uma2 family endonuclease
LLADNHRGSWKQWEENDTPMTVVFEVLSPGNDAFEMIDKFHFYDDHGVEEYYVYDPDKNQLIVYTRGQQTLRRVQPVHGFVSPRLKIRFDLSGDEMVVYRPDGSRFLTFEELSAAFDENRQRLDRLAELSRKLLAGQATEEEKQELARLANPQTP